jgi:hypothetical protein
MGDASCIRDYVRLDNVSLEFCFGGDGPSIFSFQSDDRARSCCECGLELYVHHASCWLFLVVECVCTTESQLVFSNLYRNKHADDKLVELGVKASLQLAPDCFQFYYKSIDFRKTVELASTAGLMMISLIPQTTSSRLLEFLNLSISRGYVNMYRVQICSNFYICKPYLLLASPSPNSRNVQSADHSS